VNPVHFVGAGPGDPELLTLKAARLLAQADLVLYAGSLVPQAVLEVCPPGVRKVSSAGLDLEAQVALMARAVRAGEKVVRLHTGDPSLFGAIQEQRQLLAKAGVGSEVVPGVTAALAAAAAAGQELTLPQVSQTVIITRLSGRTPVPEKERLAALARHQATLCLYLSAGMAARAREALLEGYPPQTPVIIAYRVGWPDQKLVRTDLDSLEAAVKEHRIKRQAVFLVGRALAGEELRSFSKLYDPAFSHGWRRSETEPET